MTKKKLSIITPVFNEEEVIPLFWKRIRAVLESLADRYDWNVLFVVDRCSDNSLEVLRALARTDGRLQVLGLSSRFGHQMSLLAGLDHVADADALIMMDSDLQHPPELIPDLLKRHEAGVDVVYTIRSDSDDVSPIRKRVGAAFYRLLGHLSDVTIHENAADFRLISRRVANVLRERISERGMFLRGILSWVGYRQEAVHYLAERRAAGQSKYSFSRMISLATAGILSFSTRPLKLGIVVGIGFAILGFALGALTVIQYFAYSRAFPSGWTTIVILLLLFSGVQLIFTGIIGVYVGGIYEEVKRRPHYLVDEAINIGPQQGRLR